MNIKKMECDATISKIMRRCKIKKMHVKLNEQKISLICFYFQF